MHKDRLATGLKTAKDRARPVIIGSVRSFANFQIWKTGLGLGPGLLRSKDRTGPDFQTLIERHMKFF
jgi:hypothetical protein